MEALLERIDDRLGGVVDTRPLLSVSQTRGVVRHAELHDRPARAESFESYKIVRSGDIVFNKMSIRSGALGVAKEAGIVTYHYEVMRPRRTADARFAVYLMKSDWFTAELIRNERGIGAGGASGVRTTEVPYSVLRTIQVPDWSSGGQRQIADYLDHETAEIDAFIADLSALHSLELERRAAAVSAIVWDERSPRIRTKLVADILSGFPYRSDDFSETTDNPFRLLRGVNVGVSRIDWSDAVAAPADVVDMTREYALREGDLVLGLDRPIIRAGVRAALVDAASAGSFLVQRVARIRGLEGVVHNEWLLRALQDRRFVAFLEPDFTGVSVPHISPGQVGEFRVPVPGAPEQEKRLAEIQRLESADAAVRADIDAAILLAKERRAALITAAVTGQIDVSGFGTRAARATQPPGSVSVQTAIDESR